MKGFFFSFFPIACANTLQLLPKHWCSCCHGDSEACCYRAAVAVALICGYGISLHPMRTFDDCVFVFTRVCAHTAAVLVCVCV